MKSNKNRSLKKFTIGIKKTTKNNRVKHRRHGKGTLTSFSTNGKPSVVPVSLPAAGSTDSSLCPRPPASQSLSARTLGSPQSLHLFYEIAKEIIWWVKLNCICTILQIFNNHNLFNMMKSNCTLVNDILKRTVIVIRLTEFN